MISEKCLCYFYWPWFKYSNINYCDHYCQIESMLKYDLTYMLMQHYKNHHAVGTELFSKSSFFNPKVEKGAERSLDCFNELVVLVYAVWFVRSCEHPLWIFLVVNEFKSAKQGCAINVLSTSDDLTLSFHSSPTLLPTLLITKISVNLPGTLQ